MPTGKKDLKVNVRKTNEGFDRHSLLMKRSVALRIESKLTMRAATRELGHVHFIIGVTSIKYDDYDRNVRRCP